MSQQKLRLISPGNVFSDLLLFDFDLRSVCIFMLVAVCFLECSSCLIHCMLDSPGTAKHICCGNNPQTTKELFSDLTDFTPVKGESPPSSPDSASSTEAASEVPQLDGALHQAPVSVIWFGDYHQNRHQPPYNCSSVGVDEICPSF